jgi:hypothetical protein
MRPLPNYQQFRAAVGTRFVVAAIVDPDSDQLFELDLTLHAVSEVVRTAGSHSFALEFRGPLDFAFEQGLASLDHDRFGRIDLFLVPVGSSEGQMVYEAVFSLLVPPGT